MTASLHLDQVRRTHPGAPTPAVCDLALTVPAGDALALLGPSGSGKTSVLRLIAGLDTPDSGDIRIGERSVIGLPPEQRGIAMLSQRPMLFPHLNVTDNIAFGPRMAGASKREARAQADRYLDLVQLDGYGRRRPNTLSGGQQQRVALARALAATPAVLLLDEPFSALDTALRSDMHRLLLELRALVSPTMVMVTHDHHEAELLADRTAVIINGSVHQLASSRELYSHPSSITVGRFLGCLNEIPGVVVDGIHRSALGDIRLTDSDAVDGPATLVIRQEAVELVDSSSSTAGVRGTVERVTPHGARTLVEVRTIAGSLFAESRPGQHVRVGDAVGLVLPPDQCRALSSRHETGAPSRAGMDSDSAGVPAS